MTDDETSLPALQLTVGKEHDLQRTLANIHAVAKHLLNLTDHEARDLYVSTQPLGRLWRVEVKYGGFTLQVQEPKLGEALERTLSKLMLSVSRRLDEGATLIAALHPNASTHGTRGAIEEAVSRIRGVVMASVEEPENEPGVVIIHVQTGVLPLADRDRLCYEVGRAIASTAAFPISGMFRLNVIGFVET